MGCFDATCMVSNIGIGYNDPIVMLRLVKRKRENKGGRRTCFDTPGINMMYPGEEWAPIGLPFFGNYDDYGRIEDVTETPGVLFTRDLINRYAKDRDNPYTIEDLCDREVDGEVINHDGGPLMSGSLIMARTFMHRRVWDYLIHDVVYEGFDRENRKFFNHRGPGQFRISLEKALNSKNYLDEALGDIEDEKLSSYRKEINRYKLSEAIRGGEGDQLYGGEELYDHDPEMFLQQFPVMMALRCSMMLLRKSFLPTQTIGEQHTDDRRTKAFLDVCQEIVADKLKDRDDEED